MCDAVVMQTLMRTNQTNSKPWAVMITSVELTVQGEIVGSHHELSEVYRWIVEPNNFILSHLTFQRNNLPSSIFSHSYKNI